ncbi:hypothetical protein KY332_04375 [Candidatus Woesearchaeota archaeon]|nr:hypothetical protein [Candidatus Woesearchaeota archaeon]
MSLVAIVEETPVEIEERDFDPSQLPVLHGGQIIVAKEDSHLLMTRLVNMLSWTELKNKINEEVTDESLRKDYIKRINKLIDLSNHYERKSGKSVSYTVYNDAYKEFVEKTKYGLFPEKEEKPNS